MVRQNYDCLGKRSAFIMNITWCTKKKKHCDYYENYLVHKKESWKHYEHYGSPKKFLPKIMNLLGTQKIFFETLWSYLVNQKKIFRKVRSYFVNLLQNNKKFAVTLYLKSFCEHLTKVLLTFRRIGGVVMNAQRFIKSNR